MSNVTEKDFIVCLADGSKFVSSTNSSTLKTRSRVASAAWFPYDEASEIASYLNKMSKYRSWQALPASYAIKKFGKVPR